MSETSQTNAIGPAVRLTSTGNISGACAMQRAALAAGCYMPPSSIEGCGTCGPADACKQPGAPESLAATSQQDSATAVSSQAGAPISTSPVTSPVRGGTTCSPSSTPLPAGPPTHTQLAAAEPGPKDWLYSLVTFPAYFTPCTRCCSSKTTPKREQLITHFDVEQPTRVYCSHCPEHKTRHGALLQVRRSAFKDVVKAGDIVRFGADVCGVQQYTLNGSKVIYLNREATVEKKPSNAAAAPATCLVDGRAMMDKSSLYCSLKCKMHAEDVGFAAWLDRQDPALLAAANAAANAPPRPTIACKRTAPSSPTAAVSSGSGSGTHHGSSSGSAAYSPEGGRGKKAPRLADASPVSCAAVAGGPSSSQPTATTRRSTAAAAAAVKPRSTFGGPAVACEGAFSSLPRIRTRPADGPTAGAGLHRVNSAPAVAGANSSYSLLHPTGGSGVWAEPGDGWACSAPLLGDPWSDAQGDSSDALLALAMGTPTLGGSAPPVAGHPPSDTMALGDLDSSSPRLITTHSTAECKEWWLPSSPVLGGLGGRVLSAPVGSLYSPRLGVPGFAGPVEANAAAGLQLFGSSNGLCQLSVAPGGPAPAPAACVP